MNYMRRSQITYSPWRHSLVAAALALASMSSLAAPPSSWSSGECIGINTKCSPSSVQSKKFHPGHYMLAAGERRSSSPVSTSQFDLIKGNNNFVGVQIRYVWRDLEPTKNNYNFSHIEADLAYLRSIGKRLVMQLDVQNFDTTYIPDYILTDPVYEGGIAPNADLTGYVVKRWNFAIQDRLGALYLALAKRFDSEPYFEAFNTQETALPIACSAEPSYSPNQYRDAIKRGMDHLAVAWKNTNASQWMSFIPCGGLTQLADLAAYAEKLGLGTGGPDLIPTSSGLVNGVYTLYPQYAGRVKLSQAVQWSNYDKYWLDGTKVTSEDLVLYGVNNLHLSYIFWLNRQPEFSNEVIPTVNKYANILK